MLCLADLLDGATDAQWETPSLCEGWRIREVIAHVTMAARYSDEAFMAELADCEYDFPRLSNLIAGRDAEPPTDELVANLRSDTMLHWAPPWRWLPRRPESCGDSQPRRENRAARRLEASQWLQASTK